MKKLTKILTVLLLTAMVLALLPAMQTPAAAAGTPVLVIDSTTAVNPILDHVLDFNSYKSGGPFTVTFDWMCDLKLNDPTKSEHFASVIVEGTVYGSTTQTQVYPGYRISGKTNWQKKSFQFQNVGTYNVSGSNLQGGILRFYVLYAKGTFKIRNIKITNASGKVMYDLNTDPVVAQAITNMQALGMTECDMGELAAIDYENCPWVAGQFSTGAYAASITTDESSSTTTSSSTITRPTTQPTTKPTTAPTTQPTTQPTTAPTTAPTGQNTTKPTTATTTKPSTATTTRPTTRPTTKPSTVTVPGNQDPCANGHAYENGFCIYCGISDPNYNPCANGHDFWEGFCTRCLAEDPWYQPPTQPTQPSTNAPANNGKPSSAAIFIWIDVVLVGMIVVSAVMLFTKKKKKKGN